MIAFLHNKATLLSKGNGMNRSFIVDEVIVTQDYPIRQAIALQKTDHLPQHSRSWSAHLGGPPVERCGCCQPVRRTCRRWAQPLVAQARVLPRLWSLKQRQDSRHILSKNRRKPTRGGKARAGYGAALLIRLAADLAAKHGRGFSRPGLQRMRAFYLGWEIRSTPLSEFVAQVRLPADEDATNPGVIAKPTVAGIDPSAVTPAIFPLPWSHYIRLLSVCNGRRKAKGSQVKQGTVTVLIEPRPCPREASPGSGRRNVQVGVPGAAGQPRLDPRYGTGLPPPEVVGNRRSRAPRSRPSPACNAPGFRQSSELRPFSPPVQKPLRSSSSTQAQLVNFAWARTEHGKGRGFAVCVLRARPTCRGRYRGIAVAVCETPSGGPSF